MTFGDPVPDMFQVMHAIFVQPWVDAWDKVKPELNHTQSDYALFGGTGMATLQTSLPRQKNINSLLAGQDAVDEVEAFFGKRAEPGQCLICFDEIRIMTFQGTKACCTNHHKVLRGEWTLGMLVAVQDGLTREDGIK